MRPRLLLLPVLAATAATAALAALAACASPAGPPSASYSAEVEKIRADCEARGGTIQPTGRISGNPALDNPCRIREATAIPPR